MSKTEPHRRLAPLAALAAALTALAVTATVVVATSGEGDDEPAAASPTTQPSTSQPPTSTVPADDPADAVPSTDAAPSPADEPDPNPEPGSVPDGVVPIDVATVAEPSESPFEPIVEAFTRVATTAPALEPATTPGFTAPFFPDDPQPSDVELTNEPVFAAATGCANRCIENASVSAVGGASRRVDLRVELSDPAEVEAYVSLAPIARTETGGHLPPSSEPTATGSAGSTWTTSFNLDPGAEYHLLVRAIDEQGASSVAGSFVTPAAIGPDELATPKPCENGCVDGISVEAGDDGTELTVQLSAHAAATVEYAWSTQQFEHGDHGPYLVDPSTRAIDVAAGHVSTLRLSGLTAQTAYSVMVTATDSAGGVDTWVARVATPSPTILAGIDRIHVAGDGDDGSVNRGEISFQFGTLDNHWGNRGEAKIASNTTVRPSRDGSGTLTADGHGKYGNVMVFAGERDGTSLRTCFIGADSNGWRPKATITWCNAARTMWSFAYAPSLTLAEIQMLPSCADFGVTYPEADHCLRFETAPNSSDQVSFDAVVWFDIDTL